MLIKPQLREFGVQAVLAISFLLFLHATITAQEYGFDVWTTANGLPQNTVTGVVQTPDGYLWLSTFDGLARFDGVRFTIFDKGNTKGIVNNRFARLFVDLEGVLYAFTEDNVLTVYRNGAFVSYPQFATSSEPVRAIVSNAKGNPVFETDKGYYSLQGDQFVLTSEKREPSVKKIYWGKSGAKWVIERNQITRQKDGQSTTYPLKLSADELAAITGLVLFEDSRDALWVRRSAAAELWRLQEGKATVFTKKEISAFNELYPNQAKESPDGSIWFLFSGGTLPKPSQFVSFKDNQFTSYELHESIGPIASLVDREGNFWLATSTGLRRLRRKLIATLSVKDGLNINEVYPLIQTANGDIFIGTSQGVNRFADGKITNPGLTYSTKAPLNMRGLWEDEQRRLWLGYQGDGGFGRFEEPRSVRRVGKSDFPNGATDFASDREGNIWVATDEGLFKYKDDQEIAHYTARDGLPSGRVITIHLDRHESLWLGTFDGLSQFKDGRFINYNSEANSPKGFVREIYEDAEGVLWFGTYGDGLVRLKDGKFFNYRVEHGLFNNGVFAILEDSRGSFWMSSNRGIHRVSKQELNDFADGKISKLNSVSYDQKDGMLNVECNGGRLPAGIKTKDGKLWFSTLGGVAIVDPEAESFNPNPPPVVIENISIDRKPVDLGTSPAEVVLQPGQSNIAIEYTGLSLIKSEQIKFKYKLEGLESNWVDAGTKRTVDYSYLPAGSYTFRLVAANANGVWNHEGAVLRIVVRPFFYQTWWFIGLLALAFSSFIGWVYYNRVSRLRAIAAATTLFSRQLIESQEAERKRIASELHDGLGQSLVIIKNRAMLGLKKGDDKERVDRELGSISESASQALEEVREITNNLRPQLLDRLGLTRAIQSMLKKVAGVVEIESEIDLIDDLFTENEEISIYRIVQESVNNIIKHSNASNASVSIKRDASSVAIKIEDNGKGFDLANTNAERRKLGLVGLNERAQLLRGEVLIESRPGAGTKIRVSIPIEKVRTN
jgi:signal transduction histidine kinase/ligand-binding sensor domain-containing protein